MTIHNTFKSSDHVAGDKFQQQGNHNKIVLDSPKDTKAKLIVVLIIAPLVVGILLLCAEYFGFMSLGS